MIDGEIFEIKARRCKRFGGLLTSHESLRDGYGHSCKLKVKREQLAKEAAKNQMSLFLDMEAGYGETDNS